MLDGIREATLYGLPVLSAPRRICWLPTVDGFQWLCQILSNDTPSKPSSFTYNSKSYSMLRLNISFRAFIALQLTVMFLINVFSTHSTRDPTKWWSITVQTLVVRWWSSLMTVHHFMIDSITMISTLAMFKMDTGSSTSILITEADNTSWDQVNTGGTATGVPWAQELVLSDVLPSKTEKHEWKKLCNEPFLTLLLENKWKHLFVWFTLAAIQMPVSFWKTVSVGSYSNLLTLKQIWPQLCRLMIVSVLYI